HHGLGLGGGQRQQHWSGAEQGGSHGQRVRPCAKRSGRVGRLVYGYRGRDNQILACASRAQAFALSTELRAPRPPEAPALLPSGCRTMTGFRNGPDMLGAALGRGADMNRSVRITVML